MPATDAIAPGAHAAHADTPVVDAAVPTRHAAHVVTALTLAVE
ncbi:MAG: hypothetical protein Q7V62_05830 [Actinomycetota bacterium]|nr:hypothetical protein [Actinomycetota bacterium]